MTFCDVFCMGKMRISVYALCILQLCDIVITPLACAWPVGLALHPRLGEKASEINIARILRGAKESVCFSFQYLAFISGLACHHKVH